MYRSELLVLKCIGHFRSEFASSGTKLTKVEHVNRSAHAWSRDRPSSIFATDWQAAELDTPLLRPRDMRGVPGERGRVDIGLTLGSPW